MTSDMPPTDAEARAQQLVDWLKWQNAILDPFVEDIMAKVRDRGYDPYNKPCEFRRAADARRTQAR